MQFSKIISGIFLFAFLLTLSSFSFPTVAGEHPTPISKLTKVDKNGNKLLQTTVLIDKNTSREDLIQTCQFLAKEEIQLTFEQLSIRRSFLGLLGKSRIAYAKGQIAMPDGSVERFEAGGLTNFQSIKITYAQNVENGVPYLEMIEIRN